MEVEIEMGETDKSGDGGKSDSEGSRSEREEVVSVMAAAAAAATERGADKMRNPTLIGCSGGGSSECERW